MKLWRKKFIYYLIYLEKQNKFNVYIFHKLRFIYRPDHVYVCGNWYHSTKITVKVVSMYCTCVFNSVCVCLASMLNCAANNYNYVVAVGDICLHNVHKALEIAVGFPW